MSFTYVCFVILSFSFDFITSSQVITKSELNVKNDQESNLQPLKTISISQTYLTISGENATFQNIDFVEIVKEDLQRNNEDYGEIKYNNKLTSAAKKYYGITKKDTTTLIVKINKILKSNRRTNVDSSEYSYDEKGKSTTKEPQHITNATTKVKPVQELLRSKANKKIVMKKIVKRLNKIGITMMPPHTIKPTTNATQSLQMKDDKIPKFIKKNKIEKFKKFMSNNKGLLKSFMSSKMEIQTQKTILKNPFRANAVFNNLIQPRGMANVIDNDELFREGEIMNLRSVDLLDMAPAKGGRIHRQRIKGRLCQRHVLVPEGPKYDSQGKWYLPAHNLVLNHPYNVTSPPKLILPRCCNCCKKSVLGCE